MRRKDVKNIVSSTKQVKKLRKLKVHLREILASHLKQYIQIKTIYDVIDSIRVIFKDEKLSKEASIERFQEIQADLKEKFDGCAFPDDYRGGLENLLKTMKSWESKLFTFKSTPLLPKTNNGMEIFFNEKKRWQSRTSGLKKVNKTFKLFGNYLIFIDTSLSYEEIMKILNQIEYEDCLKKD